MSTADQAGYIYILRNASLRGTPLKIGLTRDLAATRAKSLNTATPEDFEIVHEVPVRSVIVAEKRVHLMLDEVRIKPNKEFFNLGEVEAIGMAKLIASYEDEDGSIANEVEFNDDFGSRSYLGMRSVQCRKLINVMMATTTNVTLFDRMVGIRRGIVDGFLSHHQFAEHLGVSPGQASRHFRRFQEQHQDLIARFSPDTPAARSSIDLKVFEFLRCHEGELAWRFTDDYRQTFINTKL